MDHDFFIILLVTMEQQRWQQQRRQALRLQQIRRNYIRLRNLRDASNPFDMPEAAFIAKYRLRRDMARALVEELRPYMRAPQRVTAIPIHLKVLGSLHFFGHGSDQKGVASDNSASMSQPSFSRSLMEVVTALNAPAVLMAGVAFPNTPDARNKIIQRNFRSNSIPGVLGYVDGAHMNIVGPQIHEEQYVNRHGVHSLNAQVTCTSDMIIINILARYPGSSNDSFVWANSAVRAKMEELYRGGEQCWLLGDSGYPNEPWLHIPVADADPHTREANFNNAHMIDRSIVERTIGHLRNRFRCLSKHRVLEYEPIKAGFIVNACAVLHNKCVRANIPRPQSPHSSGDEDSSSDEDQPPPSIVHHGRVRDRLLQEARTVRDRIILRVPPVVIRAPFNPRRPHRRAER